MKEKQYSNKILNNNKGITLIALVVTIVVLIILATISINLVMNGNIIGRAEKSSGIQEKSSELERLELIKGSAAIENKGKVTVDNYMKEAIKDGVVEGVTKPEELEPKNDDESQDFITDKGWSVNVAPDPENPNNVIITIEGEKGKLPPRITKLELERNEAETELTATIEVKRAEGATYKYYYKTEEGEYTLITGKEGMNEQGETTMASVTIPVSEDELYTIKVETKNQYGEGKPKIETEKEKITIPNEPDLSGFSSNHTYYVEYDETGTNIIREDRKIQKDASGKLTNMPDNWYNYAESKWANVVVKAEGKTTYYTWIPRYEYTIIAKNAANPATARTKVKFIPTTKTTETNKYTIPDAFKFGGTQLAGYWISKYTVGEVSGQAGLQANPSTNYKTEKTLSYTAESGGNEGWLTAIRKMEVDGSLGITGGSITESTLVGPTNNNIDVHCIKSSEYGTMAILSASSYGNPSNERVITTTTGNNTGVMINTGYFEWTASVGDKQYLYHSTSAQDKYVDVYPTGQLTSTTAKKGDALADCLRWHNASFSEWSNGNDNGFRRGGGGIFSFRGKYASQNLSSMKYIRQCISRHSLCACSSSVWCSIVIITKRACQE